MSLVITKLTGNYFSLVFDGGEPISSEQNRLTTIGDFCNFKTQNGANLILKQNVLFSDITIITGVSHVPTSINDLWTSLIDAGFFVGLGGSGGGAVVDRFDELLDTFTYFGRDGQLLIVNESELKLDTVAYQIFTTEDKLKLDNIEEGAQVNVNPDWDLTDPTNKGTILNKPDLSAIGIFSVRYAGAGQDYEVPADAICFQAYINDGIQHLEQAGFESDLNTFTQTATTTTFKDEVPTGARVILYYYQ